MDETYDEEIQDIIDSVTFEVENQNHKAPTAKIKRISLTVIVIVAVVGIILLAYFMIVKQKKNNYNKKVS